MNFDVHVHEMHRKVMGHLLFFNKVRDKFDSGTRKTVVESIALSAVNYCLRVYGTTTGTLLSRVQQIQNFAAKICAGGARRSDHATPFIAQLEWLKMDKKIIFDVAVHLYKIKNKMFLDWYMHLPTHNEATRHNYTTRHKHRLQVPLTHTDTGGHSVTVLGPRVWNTLPQHVTDSATLSGFKKRLKDFLIVDDVSNI